MSVSLNPQVPISWQTDPIPGGGRRSRVSKRRLRRDRSHEDGDGIASGRERLRALREKTRRRAALGNHSMQIRLGRFFQSPDGVFVRRRISGV